MIEQFIEGKNQSIEKDLDHVLSEVRQLSKGDISYRDLDRDYYTLVVYLFNSDKEFFKKKPRKKMEGIQRIKELLEEPSAVNAFV